MSLMGSPVKGSTLITLAPRSANTAPALGAAIQLSISITVMSSKGAFIKFPLASNLRRFSLFELFLT